MNCRREGGGRVLNTKKWRTVLEEIGGAKQFGGKLNGDSIRGQRAKDTIELHLGESEKWKLGLDLAHLAQRTSDVTNISK